MVIGLDLEDCGNLHHSQNKIEQRENRAGTWYCPIKNQYLNNKKYCSKNNCKYYFPFRYISVDVMDL